MISAHYHSITTVENDANVEEKLRKPYCITTILRTPSGFINTSQELETFKANLDIVKFRSKFLTPTGITADGKTSHIINISTHRDRETYGL